MLRRTMNAKTRLVITSLAIVFIAGTVGTAQAAISDVASAKSLSNAFRAAADQVLPSVVAIENRPKLVQAQPQGGQGFSDRFDGQNPLEGTPFEDFFKHGSNGHRQFRQLPNSGAAGIGSGVIIDAAGVILTNNHVVAGGGDVTVRLHDGREFRATAVKTDPKTDLAIVRIEGATNLRAARLGDSDQAQVGDWVLALGQPFGLESTVTAGIISGKHRGIGIAARENFLQTDAAINPGNSGGPLVNLDGEVVGINTAISSRSGGNNGVGFAVPVNLVKWVTNQLLKDGIVHRAYLGVGIQPVTQELASQFGVNPRQGVVITHAFPNTPAAKMGLREGDIIVSLDGEQVSTAQELQLLVEQTELRQSHPMEIIRDGKTISLNFTPEAQPEEFGDLSSRQGMAPNDNSPAASDLGIAFDTLTADVAKQLGMENIRGVVITAVQSGSVADQAGLEPGMVIRQIDRQNVKDAAAASKHLAEVTQGKGVLLLVQTDAGPRFLVLKK